MTNKTLSTISRGAHKVGFALKKHSPEILITVGTIGVVASTVLACKSTLKASEVLENTKQNLDQIKAAKELAESGEIDADQYTDADYKKDLAITYRNVSVDMIKLYAPSVILGALSLTCIFTSNNILRKRTAALAAAYATIDTAFKEYRGRVTDRFGEDVDYELRHGITKETIEKKVTDENGKTKTVKEKVDVVNVDGISDYARMFDRTNPNWMYDEDQSDAIDAMGDYINSIQNYANDMLIVKGRLTLNEVYDMLGFESSKAGMVVGWVYDKNDRQNGDGYIEFHAKKVQFRDENDMFDTGWLLDFNVDGDIYTNFK